MAAAPFAHSQPPTTGSDQCVLHPIDRPVGTRSSEPKDGSPNTDPDTPIPTRSSFTSVQLRGSAPEPVCPNPCDEGAEVRPRHDVACGQAAKASLVAALADALT